MKRRKNNNEFGALRSIFENSQVPERLMPDGIKDMLDRHGYKKPKRNIGRIAASCTAVAAAAAVAFGLVRYSGTDSFSKEDMKEFTAQNISTMRFAESYDDVRNYIEKMKNNYAVYEDISAEESASVDEYDISGEENNMDIPNYNNSDDTATQNIPYKESGDLPVMGADNGNKDIAQNLPHKKTANESSALDTNTESGESEETPEYSDTYNQEKDVLEADIVKTDGKTIYYASGLQLHAVDVKDGKFENLRTVKTDYDKDDSHGSMQDLYIYDDKLIVISDLSNYSGSYLSRGYDKTGVLICDKDTLEIKEKYVQEGGYIDVRLRADGQLFIVTNDIYVTADSDPIPEYTVDGETKQVECDDILLPTDECDTNYYDMCYINVAVLDMDSDTPTTPTDMKSIIGNAYHVYCSYDNLYIAGGYEETAVTRFALTGGKVIPRAGAMIKGYINDQFSMSEWNGFFRIATTFYTEDIGGLSGADRNNAVYVMNMELKEVGKITNFGLDEEIKSVNFSGDKAYVVTFRNTDPLFAIDLSDPAKPVVTDELKVTGYSGYMQRWADGQLFGFGEEGDENGQLDGLKISMFDNSDPNNLKLLDSVSITSKEADTSRGSIKEYYTADVGSTAFYDRKSLLILPDKNIIGIPYIVFKVRTYFDDGTEDEHDDYVTTAGYRFYSFSDGKFKELGDMNMTEYTDDTEFHFNRCVLIGQYLYMVSDRKILSVDTDGFKKANEIDLPEYHPEYDPDTATEYLDEESAAPEESSGIPEEETSAPADEYQYLDWGSEGEHYIDKDGNLYVNGKYMGIVD